MTFNPERITEFEKLFDERSHLIRTFDGCERLDLVRDIGSPNVMTTISVWTSEEALAGYRESEIFKNTWSITKRMFADRPEAASYVLIRSVEPE